MIGNLHCVVLNGLTAVWNFRCRPRRNIRVVVRNNLRRAIPLKEGLFFCYYSRMVKQFIPGDQVPQAGAYRVYHYKHRMPHLVNTLLVEFPQCSKCAEKVRFEQTATDADAAGKWLRHDPDFMDTTAGMKIRKPTAVRALKNLLLPILSTFTTFWSSASL